MADAHHPTHPTQFLDSLEQHVLTSLSTAIRVAEHERGELHAELEAFETFVERLAMITPTADVDGLGPSPAVAVGTPTGTRMERVRTAYRETVMSVSHYDEVYGESLVENIAAEFGHDLAEGVRAGASVPLSEPLRNALHTAAVQAVQERRRGIDTLDEEFQLIEDARIELAALIADLDSTLIPDWYRETFETRLDAVATERQEKLGSRPSLPRTDTHSLCTYLYQQEPWTYPVLTAVTRLRETVVL